MIRFPQKHIADSVVERILRFAKEQRALSDSVAAQGARLDAQLAQPVGDVAAVNGIEDALVAKAIDV